MLVQTIRALGERKFSRCAAKSIPLAALIASDYSHPFGGEPLLCELLVESVKSAA